jgi:hypothetical protein
MKRASQAWNTLAALPTAMALIISFGWEWILRSWPSTDVRKSLGRPRKGMPNQPKLEIAWVAVTDNGKRQLLMRWSASAKSGLGQGAA